MGRARPPKQILVVENDKDARDLTAALFEETELAVVEYADWESAFRHLEHAADQVAMVFGDLDGADGAPEVVATMRRRWPGVELVLTGSRRSGRVPSDTRFMQKPWRALEVLIAAENAAGLRN